MSVVCVSCCSFALGPEGMHSHSRDLVICDWCVCILTCSVVIAVLGLTGMHTRSMDPNIVWMELVRFACTIVTGTDRHVRTQYGPEHEWLDRGLLRYLRAREWKLDAAFKVHLSPQMYSCACVWDSAYITVRVLIDVHASVCIHQCACISVCLVEYVCITVRVLIEVHASVCMY